MDKTVLAKAVRVTVPIFFGYLAIGIPFGMMMVQAGYPAWLALCMSLAMYAGAGQYAAVGLFTAGLPLAQIVLTEFFVNVRHIVYGLSLLDKSRLAGKGRPYLIFSLTDETYALLAGMEAPPSLDAGAFYTAVAALDQLYWVLGTLVGAGAGTLLAHWGLAGLLEHVDFALTALFAVILVEQVTTTKEAFAPAVGAACALGAVLLYRLGGMDASWIIIVSVGAALSVLFPVKGRRFFHG